MITPTWTPDPPVHPGWTSFRLRLKKSAIDRHEELITHLEDLRPTLLLFLRKLRAIKIDIVDGPFYVLHRQDIDGYVSRLSRFGTTSFSTDYLVVRHVVKTMPDAEKRTGLSESEIVLAFPFQGEGVPLVQSQDVHAFLPLRPCGFSVRISILFIFRVLIRGSSSSKQIF